MKNTSAEIKDLVKEKYTEIAVQSAGENKSCCGIVSCCSGDEVNMTEDYTTLLGYQPEADLGLGCGLPTEFAKIKDGDTVVDLGSGAGNDCFIARKYVGNNGKIIGVDFTEAMISRARDNAQKLGLNNVEFRLGDIEELPVSSNVVDVVVSNCVLNLVPNKEKVFSEIFRVLKQKKHFSISDIVLEGELPDGLLQVAELYAGCVSGAIQKSVYIDIIRKTGFVNIEIRREKKISLPDNILLDYISATEVEKWKASGAAIYSITVYAEKPCCEPGNGCC
jgi:SAM-dependent methyltransferase